jgi:hypothetical protein
MTTTPEPTQQTHAALQEHAPDVVLALTLAAKVLDAWQAASTKEQIAVYAVLPDLGRTLDELSFGPQP